MKKVAIVLLMGLAIGTTFMSCSKEELPTVEQNIDCLDLITGLRYNYIGCDCYQVIITNQNDGSFEVFLVDVSTYEYYRNQHTNDLSMCFDGFH